MAGYTKQRSNWLDYPTTSTPILAANLNGLETAIYDLKYLGRNAKDYGALGDGTTDDTAAIQAAIDAGTNAFVPESTYRVDGTLALAAGKSLVLGGTLKRFSAYTASTAPVVRITGDMESRLSGFGRIETQNGSPSGIVHVGPPVQTVTTNVGWWKINDITIVGVRANANIGICLTSSQVAPGVGSGAGSNYNGEVNGVLISTVGTGVLENELCNAHNFTNVHFTDIGQYCYRLAGTTSGVQESNHAGGFTHNSPFNITVLKLERAMFCTFLGVQAEPQASAGPIYYDIDANSSYTTIVGYGNTPTDLSVDNGTYSTLLDRGVIKAALMYLRRAAGNQVWDVRRIGDANPRATMDVDGTLTLGPGNAAVDTSWYRGGVARLETGADIAISAAGKGLRVSEGTNGKMGTAVLVAGTKVVSTTATTANSRILLTSQVDGGTPGFLRVSARTAGTSFTILSSNAADTSTVAWMILEPA